MCIKKKIKIVEIDYRFLFRQSSKIIFIDKENSYTTRDRDVSVRLFKFEKKTFYVSYISLLERVEVSIRFVENVHFQNRLVILETECRIDFVVVIQRLLSKYLEIRCLNFFVLRMHIDLNAWCIKHLIDVFIACWFKNSKLSTLSIVRLIRVQSSITWHLFISADFCVECFFFNFYLFN